MCQKLLLRVKPEKVKDVNQNLGSGILVELKCRVEGRLGEYQW